MSACGMDFGDLVEVGLRLSPRWVLGWLGSATLLVLALVPGLRDPLISGYMEWQSEKVLSQLEPLLSPSATPSTAASTLPEAPPFGHADELRTRISTLGVAGVSTPLAPGAAIANEAR